MIVGIASASLSAQEGEEEKPTSFWMQKKLEYSQRILSGLATEDFEALRKNATAMQNLNRIEGFARRRDAKEYRTQLQIFEYANSELIRSANQQNIEAGALAFTQLTLSCVNCHKVIREPELAEKK
ncbi:MAG: hypothetical protein KF708_20905 [Pirellulales bacterium]|nr:hypothetical protein [Pirellulales bacterium]